MRDEDERHDDNAFVGGGGDDRVPVLMLPVSA